MSFTAYYQIGGAVISTFKMTWVFAVFPQFFSDFVPISFLHLHLPVIRAVEILADSIFKYFLLCRLFHSLARSFK